MDWIPWVKTLHVLSVIAWMAALLYLPRLFVYHADAAPGSDKSETFKVMERRLLRGIANPSMVVVWATGIALYVASEFWTEGWMHAKWLGVIALTLLHHACARWRKDFERDRERPVRPLLPGLERGAGAVRDPHRRSGDRQTLLTWPSAHRLPPAPPPPGHFDRSRPEGGGVEKSFLPRCFGRAPQSKDFSTPRLAPLRSK